jgi:sugar phosphate isomerase/epimerase
MTAFSYQLYSSRNSPPLAETLGLLAGLGYSAVEGYGDLFAGLEDPAVLRARLDEVGLSMPTGHFGIDMVEQSPIRVIDIARVIGIEAVFVPAIPKSERLKDARGWVAFGERLLRVGQPLLDAGLSFGWHNHAFEFVPVETGEVPLDLILSASEDLSMEVDLAWMVRGEADPFDWIERLAPRILAAHLKDIAPEGQAADEDGWADLGHGTMDWPALMAALRNTPCRHFVIEHDNPSDDARFARRSIEAGRAL